MSPGPPGTAGRLVCATFPTPGRPWRGGSLAPSKPILSADRATCSGEGRQPVLTCRSRSRG